MSDLLAKRKAARETTVEACGHKWTLRRPTAYERATIGGLDRLELICKFVSGWDLTELDLIPGGSPVAVPFDQDLLADYMADTPSLWEPLTLALSKSIEDHDARLEDAAKN